MWENLSLGFANNTGVDQTAQSDQRIFYSLIGKYHIQTCYLWNFNFLGSLYSWGGWFEQDHVANPEDRYSRHKDHI